MPTTDRAARPLDGADTTQLAIWMSEVTLRLAAPADRGAVAELAALEGALPLRPPVLLAEQDGRLRAARSLHDGAMVADPFARTAHLVRLLAAHAEAAPPRRRLLGRLRDFIARWEETWERNPPGAALGTSGQDALRAMERAAAQRPVRTAGE
jgi:hypothetical protein